MLRSVPFRFAALSVRGRMTACAEAPWAQNPAALAGDALHDRTANPAVRKWRLIALGIACPSARIRPLRWRPMARYIQRISLRPYSETEIWTGWELEGRDGPIDGLVLAESLSEEDLAKLGVTDFQKIPREYLDSGEFLPRK